MILCALLLLQTKLCTRLAFNLKCSLGKIETTCDCEFILFVGVSLCALFVKHNISLAVSLPSLLYVYVCVGGGGY